MKKQIKNSQIKLFEEKRVRTFWDKENKVVINCHGLKFPAKDGIGLLQDTKADEFIENGDNDE